MAKNPIKWAKNQVSASLPSLSKWANAAPDGHRNFLYSVLLLISLTPNLNLNSYLCRKFYLTKYLQVGGLPLFN